MRSGHIEIEYSLLQELVILAERGLNDLEDDLRMGADVPDDEIITATEAVRAAQGLL